MSLRKIAEFRFGDVRRLELFWSVRFPLLFLPFFLFFFFLPPPFPRGRQKERRKKKKRKKKGRGERWGERKRNIRRKICSTKWNYRTTTISHYTRGRTCSASLVPRLPRPFNTWNTYRTTRIVTFVSVERLLPRIGRDVVDFIILSQRNKLIRGPRRDAPSFNFCYARSSKNVRSRKRYVQG